MQGPIVQGLIVQGLIVQRLMVRSHGARLISGRSTRT